MKTHNYILGLLSVAAIATGMTSCSDDFIKEELITTRNNEYFQTQDGIDDLITGTYETLKFKFEYDTWCSKLWPIGTDEFTDGNGDDANFNGYMVISTNKSISELWTAMYKYIENANLALKYIDEAYDHSASTYSTRKGEAYFLRAFSYFQLVQQFGGVPLKLEASDGVFTTDYERASAEESYKQIIDDFEQAYQLLPTNTQKEAIGRITKEAAAHFIAKAKLFRQSELNASWNSAYKDADLNDIIAKADEVIAAHPLCDDYVDLWNYTEPNGANEKVSEVVLAAQFDAEQSTRGRYGNQVHMGFDPKYSTLGGCTRDIAGDRDMARLRTTDYAVDVFDRVNDSRFWKSFITTYGCNNAKAAPSWPSNATLPVGASAGAKRFAANGLAIKYIVNNAGDDEYEDFGTLGDVTRNGVLQAPHTFVRYYKGEAQNWTKGHGNCQNYDYKKYWIGLSKFRDGYREAVNTQPGTRDGIVARSAEDVLFAAEAYARKGDYAKTVEYVNKLRRRAAYKAGEDRAKHVDGGQSYKNNPNVDQSKPVAYYATNTYFESNKLEGHEAEINAQSSESNLVLNGVSDILNSEIDNRIYNALTDKTNFGTDETFSKVMNFILNERTRELCGEFQRWIDLARCKALKGRWEAFNDGCGREGHATFEDYMYLRPIPQTVYLDAITTDNAQSQQNPGY